MPQAEFPTRHGAELSRNKETRNLETPSGQVVLTYHFPNDLPQRGQTYPFHVLAPGFHSPDYRDNNGTVRSYWDEYILMLKQIYFGHPFGALTFAWPGQTLDQVKADKGKGRYEVMYQFEALQDILYDAYDRLPGGMDSVVVEAHSMGAQSTLRAFGEPFGANNSFMELWLLLCGLTPAQAQLVLHMPGFGLHNGLLARVKMLQGIPSSPELTNRLGGPFVDAFTQDLIERGMITDRNDYYRGMTGILPAHTSRVHSGHFLHPFDPIPLIQSASIQDFGGIHLVRAGTERMVAEQGINQCAKTIRLLGVGTVTTLQNTTTHTAHMVAQECGLQEVMEQILRWPHADLREYA